MILLLSILLRCSRARGERVALGKNLKARDVEDWLSSVEARMKLSLHGLMKAGLIDYENSDGSYGTRYDLGVLRCFHFVDGLVVGGTFFLNLSHSTGRRDGGADDVGARLREGSERRLYADVVPDAIR